MARHTAGILLAALACMLDSRSAKHWPARHLCPQMCRSPSCTSSHIGPNSHIPWFRRNPGMLFFCCCWLPGVFGTTLQVCVSPRAQQAAFTGALLRSAGETVVGQYHAFAIAAGARYEDCFEASGSARKPWPPLMPAGASTNSPRACAAGRQRHILGARCSRRPGPSPRPSGGPSGGRRRCLAAWFAAACPSTTWVGLLRTPPGCPRGERRHPPLRLAASRVAARRSRGDAVRFGVARGKPHGAATVDESSEC